MKNVCVSLTERDVERIARRVAELLTAPELMNTKQCAQWLGLAPSSVRRRVAEGTIPYHRRGGRLYFDKREIAKLYTGGSAESLVMTPEMARVGRPWRRP